MLLTNWLSSLSNRLRRPKLGRGRARRNANSLQRQHVKSTPQVVSAVTAETLENRTLLTLLPLGFIGNPSVAVSGNFAYVVDEIQDQLQVIDVSTPSTPTVAGTVALGALDDPSIAVSGNFAYVVDAIAPGLQVIDVSTPSTPTVAGTVALGAITDPSIAVSGNFAYVVDDSVDELQVIDVSTPSTPTVAGTVALGALRDPSIAVSGNFAYVVDETVDELQVIDVSTPATPTVAGTVALGNLVDPSVAVSGDFAYVVDNRMDELQMIDVSTPSTPTVEGTVALGDLLSPSIAVSGDFAYVVDNRMDELQMIDVSSPAAPQLTGVLDVGELSLPAGGGALAVVGDFAYFPDSVTGGLRIEDVRTLSLDGVFNLGAILEASVAVSGNFAYVVDETVDELQVIDVSTPSTPTVAGTVALGDLGDVSLAVSGNFVYVVDETVDELQVIDVSTPATPTVAGTVALGNVNDPSVAVSGNFVYVVDDLVDELQVIDVTTPSTPTFEGSVALADLDDVSLAVSGNFAYVVDQGVKELQVIDVSMPTTPTVSGTVALGNLFDPSVAVSGNFVYVVDQASDKFQVIDVSTPSTPAVAGTVALGDLADPSVVVSGNFAYVVGEDIDELQMIDVSTPSAPRLAGVLDVGVVQTNPGGGSLAVADNLAYIANSATDRLQIVDIGLLESENLFTIGTITEASLQVSGNFAYVVGEDVDTLQVIDVSTPATPTGAGTVALGDLRDASVAVSGNFAYVVGEDVDTLQVIDVTTPATPTVAGTVNLGIIKDPSIVVSGNFAYVVDEFQDTLQVIDVSTPATPAVAGTVALEGLNDPSVAVSGNFAYVVDEFQRELQVIDVSMPSTPTVAGTVALGALTDPSIAVSGNFAYVVDEFQHGLQVIDVSTPSTPTVAGTVVLGSLVNPSIAVSGNTVYVVGSLTGLQAIDVSTPETPQFVGVFDVGGFVPPLGTQPLAVVGDLAYIANSGKDRLQVFDISTTPNVDLSASVNAGTEAGTTTITVTATADAAVSGNQTVDLAVTDSTTNDLVTGGIRPTDFTLSNTTITILDGETEGTVTFTILDDLLVEGDETATLTISTPSDGIALGTTLTQNVAITDNDFDTEVTLVGGVLTITDVTGGDSADQLTISHTGSTYTITDTGGLIIDASSIAGSANNGTASVTISDTGVTGINFDLLGGDDSTTVNSLQASLSGNFTISGTGNDSAKINGTIATTETGGVDITVGGNIELGFESSITTVNGGITLNANQQETATVGDFVGIRALGATLQTTGTGDIAVAGRGAETGNDSSGMYGLFLVNGVNIESTATGADAGTITLNGTGGNGTSSNTGVLLTSSSVVTSVDGNIEITGQGGNGSGARNRGILISSSETVSSTGTGVNAATITINGTGGNGTSDNHGVSISGAATSISSVDGNVTITGQGGDGSGDNNLGVNIQDDATVQVTNGDFRVTGTAVAGNSSGVRLSETDGGRLLSTGSSFITVTGFGNGTAPDLIAGADSIIGGPSATGNVILRADSISLGVGTDSTSVQSSGSLSIQPNNADTTIGIGDGAAGTLNLDATELGFLQDGFSSIAIGNGQIGSGAVDINASTFTDPVTIVGGSISVTELNAGTNDLTLTATAGQIGAGGDVGADITASDVTLRTLTTSAGIGSIGSSGESITLAATSLTTDSSASAGAQWLVDLDSVLADSLNAGDGGVIVLAGGEFDLAAADSINDTARVSLFDTAGVVLDLNGFDETVATLYGGGSTGGDVALGANTLTVDQTDLTVPLFSSTFNGQISGDAQSGLTKAGAGRWTLTSANTYEGVTNINAGELWISDDGALGTVGADSNTIVASGAELYISANGTYAEHLDLAGELAVGLGESFITPEWSGPIAISGGAVKIETNHAQDVLTISGAISGTDGFHKLGRGTVILSGTNTYTGITEIVGGELQVNGAIAAGDFVRVNDTATLSGNGTISATVAASAGSTVAPGTSPGILSTGNLSFFLDTAQLDIEIGGTTAGNSAANHDQVNVTGHVSITGASLNVAAYNDFVPSAGDEFTIINNDGTDAVSAGEGGTLGFAGLPEGAQISADFLGSGLAAFISYEGDDGNDVVISVAGEQNTDPAISVGDLSYTEDQNEGFGVVIDKTATVTDADGDTDWDGGTLSVQITGNAEAGDEISITPFNVSLLALEIQDASSGSPVTFGTMSHNYGTITGSDTLTISFNSNATKALVQEVLQSITYRTNSDTPSVVDRTVTFTATDKNGASSSDTSTISVTANNDPATVSFANTVSLTEDTPTSSSVKVADVVVTDPDGGQNSLALSGADDEFFTLVGTELHLLADTILDAETKPTYSLNVDVDDLSIEGTPDNSAPFTLNVFDASMAPVVIENKDVGFSTTGAWFSQGNKPNVQDGDFLYSVAGSGENAANWSYDLAAGQYRVSVSYRDFSNRATNTPFTIRDTGADLTTVVVDQRQKPADVAEGDVTFHDLGMFNIVGGTLEVEATNNANGIVAVDAIRIERLGPVLEGPEIQVSVDGGVISDNGQATVNFRDVETDESVSKVFTVTNLGTEDLTLTNPITVPSGFTLVTGFGATTLAPFASTTFEVGVDTGSLGLQSGELSFANNDTDNVENPFNFTLQANVIPDSGIQIIDNGDAGHSMVGDWVSVTGNGKGHQNDFEFANSGTGANTSSWTFTVTPGQYHVAASWKEHTNRSMAAPFMILNDGFEVVTATADQTLASTGIDDAGSSFTSLGMFNISGTTLTVTLSDNTVGLVSADAIRIERLGDISTGPEILVTDGGSEVVDGTGLIGFGDVEIGDTAIRTVTVYNFGTEDLTLTEPITTSTGFTATNFGTTTVAPNASTTFDLQMDTSTITSLNGTVSFGNNDADEGTFNFDLQGNVTPASTVQVIDNGGAGFSTTGAWTHLFTPNGHAADFHYAAGAATETASALWNFTIDNPGQYRVSVNWRQHTNRASDAAFSLNDSDGSSVQINQLNAPKIANGIEEDGSVFEDLGVFTFNGSAVEITLSNLTADSGVIVVADAIRIERVGD